MAETYCGKTCEQCSKQEELHCPGCKAGPGRRYGNVCALAQCCREKHHETCQTCTSKSACGTYQSRETMADYRLKKQAADRMAKDQAEARAKALGKWIPVLFWLAIAGIVPAFLETDITANLPGLAMAGKGISLLLALATGAVCLKMGSQNRGYLIAGICLAVSGVIDFLLVLVTGPGQTSVWTLLATIPALAIAFVGEYYQFTAHSQVLQYLDGTLSEKWLTLWKWNIGLFAVLVGSILLILVFPLLGALLVLASAVGTVVIAVNKIICLYRMAQLFRTYAQRIPH